ncbi:MAG TPA: hypothetical protein VFS71_19115 [Flavobacterium sp.]|uniref:hypothetical protein n=1 Tax=Flavobacterium sp. TaxID=239 RepID=UPI002DBD476C|nr:hypothetical protein [Flavobacterium sp.]HEU4791803.1 hypothetical protein [Flavobacterium sp.]
MTPTAGVKVPEAALNVPPIPDDLTQVPPACSPVIKLDKLIEVELLSQTVVFPEVPATGC